MSFASKVLYTGDAVIWQFSIPFPFLDITHVNVYVNDVLMINPLNYTVSGSTVSFVSIPAVDDAIVFQRWTSPTTALVDFVDGSTLGANELDTAYLHNFYLGQEYSDSFNELVNNSILAIASGVGIVETVPDDVIAALVNEMLNQEAAATLQQRVTDIDLNAEAILTLGNGLQVQINTLASGVAAAVYIQPGEPIPGVGGIPDPITDGARWYDSDDNNKPYIYDLGTLTWLSIEDPRIGQAVADITVLQTNVSDNAAAVVTEATARSNADIATASLIALIGAQNGAQTAFIIDSTTVKIDSDVGDTFATRFSSLSTADSNNAASITSEESARITADGVLTTAVSLMGAKNAGSTAFILDTSTVKIDADGGDTFATRLTALGAADTANSASITTINTVTIPGVAADVTALEARYGVTLDVNNYITGFVQNNDGNSGNFVILADKFAVVTPSTLWLLNNGYTVGQMVRPTTPTSPSRVFRCSTAGTSGGTEPTWVTTLGATNASGTAVFTTHNDATLQPFLIDGDQIIMNGDVSINGSLILNGSIVGSALLAGTIGSTQIGANAITTTQLNANSVNASKIVAGSITATEISGTKLSAIFADLGQITAGDITLNSAGFIKGGQTAYDTGSGFFLGYSGGYKFSIGDGAGQSLTWDGTVLTINGNLFVGVYEASTTVLLSAPTQRNNTSTYSWQEHKAFTIDRSGTVRVAADLKYTNTADLVKPQWRVKKNGVQFGTQQEITGASYLEFSYDVTGVIAGDSITIELLTGIATGAPPIPFIKDAEIRGTVVIQADGGTVDTD